MARNTTIRFLRTTRANLNTQQSANGLLQGEPYLVTDEGTIAVGTGVGSYFDLASKAYVDGGGSGTKVGDLSALTGANVASGDKLPIVDVSADATLSITMAELLVSLRRLGLLPQVAFATADRSTTSGSLGDVTDLALPMEANTEYFAEWDLFVTGATQTVGAQFAVNGPASPTAVKYSLAAPTSGTAWFNAGATAYETALAVTAVLSITVPGWVKMIAHVRNGANAGNLQLRMRSETAGTSVSVQRGSRMQMQRVG